MPVFVELWDVFQGIDCFTELCPEFIVVRQVRFDDRCGDIKDVDYGVVLKVLSFISQFCETLFSY